MRDEGSSRPRTIDPRSWPLPRLSSSSVSPPEITLAISSWQIDSTSSALAGMQPAYTPHIPESACCELKLYTEYARPRFSRTSWNNLEDMPPPSPAFSTPSANLRSSVRASPPQPSTRLACSMPRDTSRRSEEHTSELQSRRDL